MDDLTITIERRLNGETFKARTVITEQSLATAIDQTELVNIVFNELWSRFDFEYEVAKDESRYVPNKTTKKIVYDGGIGY